MDSSRRGYSPLMGVSSVSSSRYGRGVLSPKSERRWWRAGQKREAFAGHALLHDLVDFFDFRHTQKRLESTSPLGFLSDCLSGPG